MQKFIVIFLLVFAISQSPSQSRGAVVIKVLSDRTEAHLKPVFEAFEKASGFKISAVFLDQGLVERLASRPTEADVVITKDAELLELAKEKNLLRAMKSEAITKAIPEAFRDKSGFYFVDAYRARTIIYSKQRVKTEQLSTYKDLASPKWKGKLCIRSGYHDYNVSLFAQMIATIGLEETKAIIKGFHDNLARNPVGGDRDQAKGIMEGQCDVALLNSYYYPIMLSNPDQKAWAEAVNVFFPDQSGKGTYVLRSGAALTNATKAPKESIRLLEFLAGREGQAIEANVTYQFPTNESVERPAALNALGAGQTEVKGGKFKLNFVPLGEIARNREVVVKLLNEVGFDKR